mgnify:CR=1 FL=1
MKRPVLGLLLPLSLMAAAAETPLEVAKAAFDRGDAAEAARIYTALAADGDGKAQYNLAILYLEGAGVAADHDKARALLQQAAAQRLPEAAYHLGRITLYGTDGVITYDAPEMQRYNSPSPPVRIYAISLIRRAAAQDLLPAIEELAAIYDQGIGIPADSRRAAYWYRRAAAKGSTVAQNTLAYHYLRGDGVVRNCPVARQLLAQAATGGDWAASGELSALYRSGECVAKSPVQAEIWQKKARDTYLRATHGQGK